MTSWTFALATASACLLDTRRYAWRDRRRAARAAGVRRRRMRARACLRCRASKRSTGDRGGGLMRAFTTLLVLLRDGVAEPPATATRETIPTSRTRASARALRPRMDELNTGFSPQEALRH